MIESLLLEEVELMETCFYKLLVVGMMINIASFIGSGINGNDELLEIDLLNPHYRFFYRKWN